MFGIIGSVGLLFVSDSGLETQHELGIAWKSLFFPASVNHPVWLFSIQASNSVWIFHYNHPDYPALW